MGKLKLNESIAAYRRKNNLTQEELALKISVSNQAVSKWEAGQCCPDISLVPMLADIFNISIDELFGKAPLNREPNFFEAFPWENDETIRILVCRGRKMLRKYSEFSDLTFTLEGEVNDVVSYMNLKCESIQNDASAEGDILINGDIAGNANCAGDLTCAGNIQNGANCGGNLNCQSISGGAECGGDLTCSGGISGGVDCGNNLSCEGDISGGVSCGNNLSCSGISGGVNCGNNLSCKGDVSGSVESGGNIDCKSIDGEVSCGGDINCQSIGGNVNCEGTISYKQAE